MGDEADGAVVPSAPVVDVNKLSVIFQHWDRLVECVDETRLRLDGLENLVAAVVKAQREADSNPAPVVLAREPSGQGAINPETYPTTSMCEHGVTRQGNSRQACVFCSSPWNGGYSCRECGKIGPGPRYACTVCRDYDMCQSCNDGGIHGHHTLVQVRHEQQVHGQIHPDTHKREQQWQVATHSEAAAAAAAAPPPARYWVARHGLAVPAVPAVPAGDPVWGPPPHPWAASVPPSRHKRH